MANQPALIIGNGASRAVLDSVTVKLRDVGKVYVCNAYYRNHPLDSFDKIVAIDDGIIKELYESGVPREKVFVPDFQERWEPEECNPNRPRSNAGMNALRDALKNGNDPIFMFGFDFLIADKEQSVSNLYDGTANYGPETRANHADHPGRINYFNWIARQYPTSSIYVVFPHHPQLARLRATNVFQISYDDFFESIV